MGLETALAAIKAAQTPMGTKGWRPCAPVLERPSEMLSEADGKALLARAGVPVPRGVQAATLNELKAKSDTLVAPFVLKGLGFAHKSEAGAVRLGLSSLEGQAEMAGASGYLAEEMVTGAVAEVLVGLRRDPVYGVTLTIGMGGVTAELLADTQTLVLPVSRTAVLNALNRLRLWPLLDGYRGRTKADSEAVVDIALRLAALMEQDAKIEEIEINPVMVKSQGAVAVDALVRIYE
jgi:acyl-CoA synthetase (NDP forming)